MNTVLDQVNQDFNRFETELNNWLVDGSERTIRQGGDGEVVEANKRNIIRDTQAGIPNSPHSADGHQVRGREDRIRAGRQ